MVVAPWPGFGPGSCGRQPHILDRTILPGLLARQKSIKAFVTDKLCQLCILAVKTGV